MSENIVGNQEFSVDETDVSFKIGGVECLDKVYVLSFVNNQKCSDDKN